MDQQRLVELLQASQIPDTQKVKAATAELRKNFYPHPDALLGLLHVIVSHPEATVRMLAAVQALRLVEKHWVNISDDQKPSVRNELLQAIVREQNAKCRHGQSRVIAAIATLDFSDGQWTDLLPAVMQLTNSDDVTHREVGSYIIFSLVEANPAYFEDHLSTLFELFAKTIRDPQSRDVRINTMQSISATLMLIDSDEDEQSLNTIQEFTPLMVDVLKDAVESGDDEKVQQCFEVFQTFLAYDSALLTRYFKDLVQFMLDLATNTAAEDDVRSQALAFLAHCVRYRRLKIQAIPDMGAQLMKKSLMILSELSDDDDDEEDNTPARRALAVIDQLASDLPPRLVIVPLLDEFKNYATSPNPGQRKACVLALGTCGEGAPDFVSTQISSIMPLVLNLLKDPEQSVRHSALLGLIHLGEDLADSMSAYHDEIMTALVMNLDAASGNESDEKNAEIIRSVCGAIESLAEGLGSEVMAKYRESMIHRIGIFISHPDPKVKSSAAGALGAIAASIKSAFIPYLKQTMEALSSYIIAESGEEELALRSSVCDAMGRMAVGVGAQEFSPYVMPLLVASEKALHLGNPRLRETTFILWSQLATVYEGDLGDSLAGIFQGLFDCLEQEEEDEPEGLDGLIDEATKKGKAKASEDAEEEYVDIMDDDDDDDDEWDDLVGVSAQAFEKEIALEVLGDVIYAAKDKSAPYIEKTLELVAPFVEHSYEGCRKTAIGTLWRSYACVWEVMESQAGVKWKAGLPLTFELSPHIAKLGEIVSTATIHVWAEEADRDVITDINRSVASTLKTCGPAILGQKDFLVQVTTILRLIINRQHPCQLDAGEEDEQDGTQGSSEWDWLVVDTALDVLIGLACALGHSFAQIWEAFEKLIVKLLSSNEAIERSTAVGVVAECISYMGMVVTPHTSTLLRPLLHRLSDEDKETKSNAAYAIGQLVCHSDDAKTYLPAYNEILSKLEPLLQITDARLQDNAAGCVCRMIIAHPDKVPIADVLPVIVDLLPLKEDFEENKPIYECIHKLYSMENPTVRELTPKILNIFRGLLEADDEQLDPYTKQLVLDMISTLSV
ncbi:importin beta-4 subunit-like protein [Annulohypoxylon maeteangense]|uniref:importin beta-4 subunit-like protein n=1 Tax=Annulohypoxylon maeteangense TaxID=1927788 RepID=UPI002007B893|nr:importin beta-4 subunit-like protein [Annulohypoxylon maeteangense]KAI0887699.1 importin beta-4 subunit-like protein [Annulohypoxylon maeteangense]